MINMVATSIGYKDWSGVSSVIGFGVWPWDILGQPFGVAMIAMGRVKWALCSAIETAI